MEEMKLIGKRVNFSAKNMQRLEILSAILKQELETNLIVNRLINS